GGGHAATMEPATRPGERPLRVMIIDCHPAFRVAASALLRTEGLQVVDDFEPDCAAEPAETSCRPDVVLIDVCVDGLDGLELARRFAAVPNPPAIVLMSAVPADRLLTAAVGADAFVSKASVTAEALTWAAASVQAR